MSRAKNSAWGWWIAILGVVVVTAALLWLRGWAVVVDGAGQVASAAIVTSGGQAQPLIRVTDRHLLAMVVRDGDLVARCVSGEEVGGIYVSWLLDGELRDPCPPRVISEEEACALTISSVATRLEFPTSNAYCDHVPAVGRQPFRVLELRANRECPGGGICSEHVGWYAVDQSTDLVYRWDVVHQSVEEPMFDIG